MVGEPQVRRPLQSDTRYLLFADILGTRSLYLAKPPKSELIQRKRNSLGHSVRTAVFPYFDQNNRDAFAISIFSDTVLIVSNNVARLSEAAARLFFTFAQYGLHARSTDELYLLRGGLSYGERLVASTISTTKHVSIAEIFDTGLALAYELEGIRKGSRLFVSKEVAGALQQLSPNYCQIWTSVTGIGPPASPAHEFLWPAVILAESPQCFANFLADLIELWHRLFKTRANWTVPAYDIALYQVDETIKVCIRSAVFAERNAAESVWTTITRFLPTSEPALADLDIRFTWGTWFQIMWVMIRLQHKYHGLMSRKELSAVLRENIAIIARKDYIGTFRSELLSADWRAFGEALKDLGAFD